MNKYFIITIDTEGDDLWTPVIRTTGMRRITVENAFYTARFQKLCEKYGFIPTYLVNHEMANADVFISGAKEWLKDYKCEIGMHMHAWNCPPFFELKYKRNINNPYAGDYPHKILWDKLKFITEEIEEKFDKRPTSHRGGRWYIDPWYISALKKLRYEVDCSVTPGVSWNDQIGYRLYGVDFRRYPDKPYYIGGRDLSRKMTDGIVEIPPTIKKYSYIEQIRELKEKPANFKDIMKRRIWLRPNGHNLEGMLKLVDCGDEYIEFMLHSSELMPGGSPTFKTGNSIEHLYHDMEILFEKIAQDRKGISLTGYSRMLRRKL